jgi:molybdate transport system substrate-binding protein
MIQFAAIFVGILRERTGMAMRTYLAAWLLAAALGSGGVAVAADDPDAVLVFGAASLTNVLDDLSQAFTARTKIAVKDSYAASSVLAKQIEAGAPADVFFSADLEWMDYLEQHKLLQPGSRHDVVTNRLVLIAPADSKVSVNLTRGMDLGPALGPDGKLATGDPDSVPVGKYAMAALQKLGAWNQVSGRIARAENVRAALAFVARGEAPLGIVYRTDALAEKKVRIVAEFPADTHPPITYPIALTLHGGDGARKFEDFVRTPAAAEIFRKYGFIVN